MQNLKCIVRRCLASFVIAHQTAAEIGREHLCRSKMLSGKTRLPGSRWTHERHYGELWNCQFHIRVKIPICVGLPTCRSSGPIGRKRTSYPNFSETLPAQD